MEVILNLPQNALDQDFCYLQTEIVGVNSFRKISLPEGKLGPWVFLLSLDLFNSSWIGHLCLASSMFLLWQCHEYRETQVLRSTAV